MEKDIGWKVFFSDKRRYADIINGIGCGGVQFVNDTDLSDVDGQTRKGMSRDLLCRSAFGVNFALIGIENQESVDYAIPLRNMSYDVAEYEKQAAKIHKEVRGSDDYYQNLEEDAFEVIVKYANASELAQAKDHRREDGKVDMCTAIREMMEDSRQEGMEAGIKEGIKEGETLFAELVTRLFADNRTEDAKLAAEDEKARKKFYREYGLID